MMWFRKKPKRGPILLSDEVLKARAAVDNHLRNIPIDCVEHVTNYDGRQQRGSRADTWGHCDMRKWLRTLAELKAEVVTVERAFRLKVSMCQALGLDPNGVTDGQTLEVVRVLHVADETVEKEQ